MFLIRKLLIGEELCTQAAVSVGLMLGSNILMIKVQIFTRLTHTLKEIKCSRYTMVVYI